VPPPGRILDVGCGTCCLALCLKRLGYDVTAVDFYYGDLPERRCREHGIPYVRCHVEADPLPFENGTFDAALLGEVIEHFTYSPLVPLRAVRDVLRPGGRLVVTTPNASRAVHLLKLLAGRNIYPELGAYTRKPLAYGGRDYAYRHNRLYTMRELRQVVADAGLEVVAGGAVSGRPPAGAARLAGACLAPVQALVPRWRDYLWLVAEKSARTESADRSR
jgi:SAM-dependent methyltransferase